MARECSGREPTGKGAGVDQHTAPSRHLASGGDGTPVEVRQRTPLPSVAPSPVRASSPRVPHSRNTRRASCLNHSLLSSLTGSSSLPVSSPRATRLQQSGQSPAGYRRSPGSPGRDVRTPTFSPTAHPTRDRAKMGVQIDSSFVPTRGPDPRLICRMLRPFHATLSAPLRPPHY